MQSRLATIEHNDIIIEVSSWSSYHRHLIDPKLDNGNSICPCMALNEGISVNMIGNWDVKIVE